MNSQRDNHDDELADPEFEPTGEPTEREPARRPWAMRIIQFALVAVLIGIVVHGLLTRSPNGAASAGRRVDTSFTVAPNTTTAASTSNAMTPPSSASRSSVAPASSDALTCDGLVSLHDIRDYLDLHRVTRETRAYQLALTSRDALLQLVITSEPKGEDNRPTSP